MLRRIGISAAVLSALALGLGLAGAIFAAKPGGSAPPPAGTIFFYYGPDTWAMKGDGSGKTLVGGLTGEPSNGVYGSNPALDRYWLQVREVGDGQVYPTAITPEGDDFPGRPRRELYAIHADGTVVQVTNLFPYMEPFQQETERWSNDGADSFVSCAVLDYTPYLYTDPDSGELRIASDDPAVNYNYANIGYILRLNISGADIDDPDFEPLNPDDHAALMNLVSTKGSVEPPLIQGGYDWSPDGTRVAIYIGGNLLMVRDVDPEGSTTELPLGRSALGVRWAPDGSRICFFGGGIWTFTPTAGSTPTQIVSNGAFYTVGGAKWSPDGQFLMVRKVKSTGTGFETSILRYKRDGSGATDLTKDLIKTQGKGDILWVKD